MTKKITESLVGKKPATASKLFAEAMEARLDELSKKTLGSYITRAGVHNSRNDARYKELEDMKEKLHHIDNNIYSKVHGEPGDWKTDSQLLVGAIRAIEHKKASLSHKHWNRDVGIHNAIKRLTKEDLDESVDESYKSHPFFQKHFATAEHAEGSSEVHHHDKNTSDGTYHHFMIIQVGPNNLHTASIRSSKGNKDHIGTGHGHSPHEAIDRALEEYHGSFKDAKHLQESDCPFELSEVEAPANFWNSGMARMNPIQVSQKQPAEPGQFKATLTKSPKRLADQDSSLEGKPRAVRDETEAAATSRGPKTIELTGDWHADVPDHQFDPKLDSETEYYPLFSQFKSLSAYPSGPAGAWESEEIDEDELNEISKKTLESYLKKAKPQKRGLSTKIKNDFKKMQHATDWSPESEAMKAAKRTNSISHKYDTRNAGIQKAEKKLSEDELNEISKKTLASYIDKAAGEIGKHAHAAGGGSGLSFAGRGRALAKAFKRVDGVRKAAKKLSEDSASLMTTATKDEKKAAEQDKKKPAEFKKLHDKHEAQVKSKMKELGEEALQEGLFDPAKQPLLALWDEHARRSDAHGSGSRTEILKRIEDHVAKKHGQEGLKKMRLHSDLSNALKNSVSGDKGHLQALLGNMRAKCAMGS